jgi:hypothetical protein
MRKSEREAIIEQQAVIAYHEAGHAVIARKLHLEGIHVSLPEAITWHETFPRDADYSTRLWADEAEAIMKLAGPIAECRYRRETVHWGSYWGSDLEEASDLVARLVTLKRNILTPVFPVPKYDELFGQLCDKTRMLVGEHWSAIERVAHGLLDFDDLTQTDVDDLIAGKLPSPRRGLKARTRTFASDRGGGFSF